jgi:hypothetical protein
MIMSRLLKVMATCFLLAATLVGIPSAASADPSPQEPDTQAVIDALIAAGVPVDLIDDEFLDDVRSAVHELVEQGIIEPQDLDELRRLHRSGEIEDHISDRIDHARGRRSEAHQAEHRARCEDEHEDDESSDDAELQSDVDDSDDENCKERPSCGEVEDLAECLPEHACGDQGPNCHNDDCDDESTDCVEQHRGRGHDADDDGLEEDHGRNRGRSRRGHDDEVA